MLTLSWIPAAALIPDKGWRRAKQGDAISSGRQIRRKTFAIALQLQCFMAIAGRWNFRTGAA
jgi:hypothetical protein